MLRFSVHPLFAFLDVFHSMRRLFSTFRRLNLWVPPGSVDLSLKAKLAPHSFSLFLQLFSGERAQRERSCATSDAAN